ncbi:MAG: N-methyl-D-aspartate receptor NMDAR2C subunit [Alphaproteobacteria bacterium]
MQLTERYAALWTRLGGTPDTVQGAAVVSAYNGPGRYYHNETHLKDVLEKLDWAKGALEKSGEVKHLSSPEKQKMFDTIELALWYHDAVYDGKAKDNEERSRDSFLQHAEKSGIPADVKKEVAALIDLTKHHKNAKTLPERILTDCDLAILGAAPAAFKAYDEGIRKEYAHVPAAVYKGARRSVLKGFLDQPRLFKTDAFHAEYDAPARANLGQAVKNPVVSWAKGLFRNHK